jgi:fructose-bisphosphate aldolase class I
MKPIPALDALLTRVVALSSDYIRAPTSNRLAANHVMIASFLLALVEDLGHSMSDASFNETLAGSIDQMYRASTVIITILGISAPM